MHSKNHRKRIILVLLLTLALCAGTWSGAYHNALLSSYAVTEEEKAQAEKEAKEAKEAAEAKKKEAKAAGKKAAEATANIEEAENSILKASKISFPTSVWYIRSSRAIRNY